MDAKNLKFLFSIGNISFFELKLSGYLFNSEQYYWKDVHDADFSGPYPDLNTAVNHCRETIKYKLKALAPVQTELPANTIQVDFKAKRRIPLTKS